MEEFDHYYAECLEKLKMKWKTTLPREVWILTTCRRRTVFETYDLAWKRWEMIERDKYRCDALEKEKYCLGQHTLLRGQDEAPLEAMQFLAHLQTFDYLKQTPGLWEKYATLHKHPAVHDLPPIEVIPPTTNHREVVYIIKQDGPELLHKIGRSFSGHARVKELQIGNPYLLVVTGEIHTANASTLEKSLHKRYAAFHRRGEWFDLPITLLAELYELMEPR